MPYVPFSQLTRRPFSAYLDQLDWLLRTRLHLKLPAFFFSIPDALYSAFKSLFLFVYALPESVLYLIECLYYVIRLNFSFRTLDFTVIWFLDLFGEVRRLWQDFCQMIYNARTYDLWVPYTGEQPFYLIAPSWKDRYAENPESTASEYREFLQLLAKCQQPRIPTGVESLDRMEQGHPSQA